MEGVIFLSKNFTTPKTPNTRKTSRVSKIFKKLRESEESYVYDPNKLSEKIGDFCEHVIAGLVLGFLFGFAFGFYWIMSIQG